MLNKLFGGPERRAFPRHEASLDVEFEIEIYGFEGQARPFFASGKTVNISRSGVLARLDVPVARGSICKLFFRHTGDQVRPQHLAGRVVRIREEDDNTFAIAVEFDEPLAHIEIERRIHVTTEA